MVFLLLLLVCSVFTLNFLTAFYTGTGCGGEPWGYGTLNSYQFVLDRFPSATDWTHPELDCMGYVFGSTSMSTQWECSEHGLEYRVYNTSSTCSGTYELVDLSSEPLYDLQCHAINDYYSYEFVCLGPRIDGGYAHVVTFDETVTNCRDDDPTHVTDNFYYVIDVCYTLGSSISFKFVSETGYDLSILAWDVADCEGNYTVSEQWASAGCVTGRRSYGSKSFEGFGEDDDSCTNTNEDGEVCPEDDDNEEDWGIGMFGMWWWKSLLYYVL